MNTRKLMQLTVAVTAMAAASLQAQAQDEVEEIRLPKLQSEKEFADAMPVTGKVETFFGDFDLQHSFPTAETSDRIYQLIDHQRASQLYLWGLPLVAQERLVVSVHGVAGDDHGAAKWEEKEA